MNVFPWATDRFWLEKEPILKRAASHRRHEDHREARGYVWEKLSQTFPDGLSPVDVASEFLDKLMFRFADCYFRNEMRRRYRRARKMRSIDDPYIELDKKTRAEIDKKMRVESESETVLTRDKFIIILQSLNDKDRTLLEMLYGIAGKERTRQEIATSDGVSQQAVGKRLRRIHRQLIQEITYDLR